MYKIGVDVGGTFTDVLLVDTQNSKFFTAKVPSTPHDSSEGVLNGIRKACAIAGADLSEIEAITHGTTVATNSILTGRGARVGLITTKGYRQVLQIARSYVPGGLGGWLYYQKTPPLAPLECTIEAHERMNADGTVHDTLDEKQLRADLAILQEQNVEAVTVCLINSFTNDAHEKRVREIVMEEMPKIPVSLSCEVIPELQEYERTITTVANSYVRPEVEKYISNLQSEFKKLMDGASLSILRSDGGLSTADAASNFPVNLLMSGPAGGVAGAIWVGEQAGLNNVITFDMGGTSTDVALIENGQALVRRETTVGDVTVRASALDVRSIGAGGGSIAHVPELTKALRVGPESAGAVPGPAAYNKGGTEPTVTDANIVLGYLPVQQKLGGDMEVRPDLAETAVQKVADALGLSLMEAAEGIIKIVNEKMFGAVRLVSVEKGYDPRDFSLMAFGGAGPLHANALGELTQAWPVIVPPGPGILCAYGDATTRLRNEASKTIIVNMKSADGGKLEEDLLALAESAKDGMGAGKGGDVDPRSVEVRYEIDIRYSGQGLVLSIPADIKDIKAGKYEKVSADFDDLHEQLFTFRLSNEKEFVNLRAVVLGPPANVELSAESASGKNKVSDAEICDHSFYYEGAMHHGKIYDRAKLEAGHIVKGPAVITEMDSTTVVLPGYEAKVDSRLNLLLSPNA
jgi:N-methylhydantoinase A